MVSKRTLLIVTPTIRAAKMKLHRRYKDTFRLRHIYNVKFVTRLEDMRGYDATARLMYIPGFYELRDIDEIRDRIKLIKFKTLN